MGVTLRVTDGEIFIFCSHSPNYLQTFIKISGWEVLLFFKIDNLKIDQVFKVCNFSNLLVLAIVSDK